MKISRMVFMPLVTLLFTRADVERLMQLSAEHYDWNCNKAGQVGGVIYGMWVELDSLDKPEVERTMNFREIDTLAKVSEQFQIPKDDVARDIQSELVRALARALELINGEYRRANEVVA